MNEIINVYAPILGLIALITMSILFLLACGKRYVKDKEFKKFLDSILGVYMDIIKGIFNTFLYLPESIKIKETMALIHDVDKIGAGNGKRSEVRLGEKGNDSGTVISTNSLVDENSGKADDLNKILGYKDELYRLINMEMNSSRTTKMILINLFVVSTISLLLTIIFLKSEFKPDTMMIIGCGYFGYSMFTVYIIKMSHNRSGVLISIIEDMLKNHEIREVAKIVGSGRPITESEGEFLNKLLINRTERESKSVHPYEYILRGVSGSNISIGNGKLEIGKK